MRLIDADALKEYVLDKWLRPEDRAMFFAFIDSAPTVDVVGEIVEKLEEKANEFRQERHRLSLAMYSEEKAYNNMKKLTQKEIGMLEAIEIVKEVGGINETET